MIKNRHQNLFYYYRGPSNKKQLNENQLEDNATKSLINILEISNKLKENRILTCFLSMIEVEESSVISFELQHTNHEGISRPDGLIKLEGKSIIIETKINAGWGKSQIDNHLKGLGTNSILLLIGKKKPENAFFEDGRIKFVFWKEIYSELKKLNLISELQEFLNQFLEYLEIIGVSEFYGFDKGDFEIVSKLKSGEITDEEKQILKAKMELLANRIVDTNKKDEKLNNYTVSDVGNMQKGDYSKAWLAIKRDDFPIKITPKTKKIKESSLSQCNLTIEIDVNEFAINAVIRNGRINQKRTPLYYFFSKLDNYVPLFNMSPELRLVVYTRVPMGGQRFGGAEQWINPKVFNFSELKTKEGVYRLKDYLRKENNLGKMKLSGISIRRSISSENPTLRKPDELIQLIKRTEVELRPFLDLIHCEEIADS